MAWQIGAPVPQIPPLGLRMVAVQNREVNAEAFRRRLRGFLEDTRVGEPDMEIVSRGCGVGGADGDVRCVRCERTSLTRMSRRVLGTLTSFILSTFREA